MGLWGAILSFATFLIILFTGKFPKTFFDYQLGLIRWNTRLSARMLNLSDGYPSFGINGSDDFTNVEVPYRENVSRGSVLIRFFFGWLYVGIPHGFVLYFRTIGVMVLVFLAWWAVLFTGKYPASWHNFNVGLIRWQNRISTYLQYMEDEYPPFTGDELESDKA